MKAAVFGVLAAGFGAPARRLRKTGWKLAVLGLAAVVATGLTLLHHWEPRGETWGYWLFARIFAEHGEFVIPDRSPLYTLYLNAFRWLGYPASVAVEHLTTSAIAVSALVVLFKPYLGLGLSVLAALLWAPFMQTAEPPVQMLALACSCWAIVARRSAGGRRGWAASYALFGLAYMFRHTYLAFIVIFAAWDILQWLRLRNPKALLAAVRPRLTLWPIVAVAGLMLWFLAMQSSHPWNNAWFATTTYFPSDGKTLTTASFIQNYNWTYIDDRYETFEGHDFYFTNQELFGGADSVTGAIQANPGYVAAQIAKNVKNVIGASAGLTELPSLYPRLPGSRYLHVAVLIALLYGAYRAVRQRSDRWMLLFLAGNLLVVGAPVLSIPKTRYLLPLIPVLILSASWYAAKGNTIAAAVRSWTTKRFVWSAALAGGLISLWLVHLLLGKPGIAALTVLLTAYVLTIGLVVVARYGFRHSAQRQITLVTMLSASLALILLSNGVSQWSARGEQVVGDLRQGQVRLMEADQFSAKASFKQLEPLVQSCHGILSLESTYIGGFMGAPLESIYDVWEIPPFGSLGNSVYDGLRPDRVDCLLVSHKLATQIGFATNYQIRYQNYIEPYMQTLRSLGATAYEIPTYGQAIILPDRQASDGGARRTGHQQPQIAGGAR